MKPLYKFAFKNANTINIFHNQDDRNTFIKIGIANIQNSKIIQGSGVNTDYFKINNKKNKFNKNVQILFPARIIKSSRINKRLQRIRKNNYKFVLNIAGEIDFQIKAILIRNILRNYKK